MNTVNETVMNSTKYGDNIMYRILHVGFSENPGGVENVVMNYYREIDRNSIQFDFLDMYGVGIAYEKDIEGLGGRVYKTENYKKHPIKVYNQIKKILIDNNYTFIHIHMQSAANLLPVLAGIKCKTRVIAHAHSSSTPNGLSRKLLHSINVRILRKLRIEKFACGKKAGIWFWGDSFSEENIIPNTIDLCKYSYKKIERERKRKEIGYKDEYVIGFVGRFGEEKNTLFLIDVLEKMLSIDGGTRLLTVGGNDLYSLFEIKIQERKIEKAHYSAGIQMDASAWYQAMDAFLLPSFFEGFPMVGLEAQAAGLPCFFSDRISREIDLTGNVVFLPIDGEDSDLMWAKEILKHRNNHRCSINNSQIEKYDTKVAVKRLEKIYTSLQ